MELIPIAPISYNDYMEFLSPLCGSSYEDFALYSLAYMYQQRKNELDSRTKGEWESKLIGTIYDKNHPDTEGAEGEVHIVPPAS